MRLYKVVILVNLALAAGFLFGYHWWGQEVVRLNQELEAARRTAVPRQAGVRRWSARGIIRGTAPERNLILITHEEIPGLMSAMTMAFPTPDGKLLRGLTPGDRVEFTLEVSGNRPVVVALRKEVTP